MTARLYLTVYARDDMLGDSLGTVNEATELSYQDVLHGTGSGRVKINRYHPQAALLVQDRYCRVHSDAGVIGAFFLEEGVVDLSSDEGKGGEFIVWTGRGPLAVLETAVMDNDSDIVGGEDPIEGFWDLSNQGPLAGNSSAHPITMFKRAVVEAKLQTPTGLGGVDHSSFTYDEDSNGDPLSFIDGEWGVNVGDDLLTVLAKLDQIGGVTFRMSTDFELSAWLTYGDDRSGTFGAGNVRFEEGVNIASAISRKVRGGVTRTHLIVGGADRIFVTVTDPDYTTGDVIRWGFLSVPESSNEDALESAGLAHIEARKRQTDVWVIPAHDHGDDEAAGIYEPGTHYFVGDTVTVHTGTGPYDADGVDSPVASVTWELKAGDEANGDYWVKVEIGSTFNWEGNKGFDSRPGSQNLFHLCQPLTPGTESLFRFYPSLDVGAADPARHANWDQEVSGTTNTIKTTADGTYPSSGTGSSSSAGGDADGVNVLYWAGMSNANIGTDLAAVLAAGGATVRAQFAVRARYGVGISEAAQNMISNMSLRVAAGATTTVRGTALAPHTLSSSAGATKWPAQSAHLNRQFPPASASSVLSAVSGTVSTDRLLLEVGSRNYTLVTSGGGLLRTSDSASDLPEDDASAKGPNCWVEIRAITAPTGDGLHPDLVGDDTSAARCDHRHHVLANRDPTTTDDITQGYPTTTLWTNTDTSQSFVLVDEDTGEWVLFASAGAHTHTASEIESLFLDSLEDVDTLTTPPTDGQALVFDDSDELWKPGTVAGGGALDDLSDVVISSPATDEVLTYNGSEWVNAVATGGGGGGGNAIELDYVQITSNVSPTATTEATANTVVTGSAVTYDGSTPVVLEFFSETVRPTATGGASLSLYLYDGSSSIGRIGLLSNPAPSGSNVLGVPVHIKRRLTPSAASHTYSIRAAVSSGTGLISAGAGGSTAVMPAFIRITAATSRVGNVWTMNKSASQTLTSNADTQITFDTAVIDGGGSVIDLANDRFVAPATGLYMAYGVWIWETTVPNATARIAVMVGGANVATLCRFSAATAGANGGMNGSFPLSLTAGDFVTMIIHPGGAVTPTARGNASVHLATSFTLVRIT